MGVSCRIAVMVKAGVNDLRCLEQMVDTSSLERDLGIYLL